MEVLRQVINPNTDQSNAWLSEVVQMSDVQQEEARRSLLDVLSSLPIVHRQLFLNVTTGVASMVFAAMVGDYKVAAAGFAWAGWVTFLEGEFRQQKESDELRLSMVTREITIRSFKPQLDSCCQ